MAEIKFNRCDRCGVTIQDHNRKVRLRPANHILEFSILNGYTFYDFKYDLCPKCTDSFVKFVEGHKIEGEED